MDYSHRKNWRKLVKKLHRKRRRQAKAKERDKALEKEEEAKLQDPAYQHWLKQQQALELCQKQTEEAQRQAAEEAWLQREKIAQQQFRIEREREVAAEAEREALRQKQNEEFAAREAHKREQRRAKAAKEAEAVEAFDNAMRLMEEYLENAELREPPEMLRRCVESKPAAQLCDFYERTNCCRFGLSCIYNHRRPLLSCIIIVRHFFRHPLLQDRKESEYASADANLELSEHDLREDYDNFFYDVCPELEKFGEIVNFRTTRNVLKHLCGHVFVEYKEERSALKAFVNLQGRYYASKRLSVEFSSFTSWRGSVCGLSFARKCPKGNNCNYLHLFRNPDNKYNTMLEQTTPKSTVRQVTPRKVMLQTPLLSWNDVQGLESKDRSRHWRWSESPEVEVQTERHNHTPAKEHKPESLNGEKDRRGRNSSSREATKEARDSHHNSQVNSHANLEPSRSNSAKYQRVSSDEAELSSFKSCESSNQRKSSTSNIAESNSSNLRKYAVDKASERLVKSETESEPAVLRSHNKRHKTSRSRSRNSSHQPKKKRKKHKREKLTSK